jgi:hypothetical protein
MMIRNALNRLAAAAAFGFLVGLMPMGTTPALAATSSDESMGRRLCEADAMATCRQCGVDEACYRACLPRKRRHEISDACYFFIHKPRHLRRRA